MRTKQFREGSPTKQSVPKRCTLDRRKDPTPKLKDLMAIRATSNNNTRDHVHENIIQVKNLECRADHPSVVQDSCDGHRQDIERAGLKLKYVFKKEYGKTPLYIRKKQLQVYEEKKQEDQTDKCNQSNVRIVSDEEKHMVLEGLKSNLKEVEKRLLAIPIIVDTISKRKRKEDLEDHLINLQRDIEMLENNDVIIIKDCKSHTA